MPLLLRCSEEIILIICWVIFNYRYWFVTTCLLQFISRGEKICSLNTRELSKGTGQTILANSVPRIFLLVLMCAYNIKQLSTGLYTRLIVQKRQQWQKIKESRIRQQASKRNWSYSHTHVTRRNPRAPKLQCCGFRLHKRLQYRTIALSFTIKFSPLKKKKSLT